MKPSTPVDIVFTPAGANGIGKIAAKVNGKTIHFDKVDTADASARDRFAEAVCRGRKTISRPAVDAELLKLAMERSAAPTESPWPPPVPLDAPGSELPPFPTDALPGVHRDFVEATADAIQVPADLIGLLSLSAIAAAAAGRWSVRVNAGWGEPVNIYTVTSQPPGSRKSAAVAAVAAPLVAWEAEQTAAKATEIEAARTRWAIADKAKARAIDAASRATDQAERIGLTQEAESCAKELASIKIPAPPKLLADDTTPERLCGLLAEYGGRMAVLSPEGGVFDVLAGGRYSASGTNNLDPLLKSHAGDPIRVDRVGRPSEHIAKPALTLGLAVQPDVIRALADQPGFSGRGLLARFIYGMPAHMVGRRNTRAPTVPSHITAGWDSLIKALLNQASDIVLSFTPPAQERLQKFVDDLEPRLAPEADLGDMAEWAGKLAGAAVRIAGLLHVAEAAGTDNMHRASSRISEATVDSAIRIAEWAIPHAMAAFRVMGTSPDIASARVVLRWIIGNGQPEFSRRDCFHALRRNRLFQVPEALDRPLQMLTDHGYIRLVTPEERRGPGRRPTTRWAVNPGILGAERGILGAARNPCPPRPEPHSGDFGDFGACVQTPDGANEGGDEV